MARRSPFKIVGPAKISFSGGRTSAFMLWKILEVYKGKLPADVHVVFANTGKEREETLEFIHQIEMRWNVPITWVERDADDKFKVVTYYTASRDGTPFEKLIVQRNFLPNPVTRFCTQELKIRVMKAWMLAQGYEHWTNVVGLRADEPRRVSRIRSSSEKDVWDVALPLAEAGVDHDQIRAFWKLQPFRLDLEEWEGNCDLCFLKGRAKRTRIMRDNPSSPDWWIRMENLTLEKRPAREKPTKVVEHVDDPNTPMLALGADFLRRTIVPKAPRGDGQGSFRYDAPAYEVLREIAQQPMMLIAEEELYGAAIDDIDDCVCNAA
jgi:phosphoadenosine phosphosulfate reductase family protein